MSVISGWWLRPLPLPSPGKFSVINTLRWRQNGHHFPDDIFKWIFLNENTWISIKIEVCSQGSNQQYSSIGSDYGLALVRWQTIIWTNEGLVYWCKYVSLCLNELIYCVSHLARSIHFRKHQNIFEFSIIPQPWDGAGSWKSLPVEDKDLFILYIKYHGCWWPGNARSQGISSNDIQT